MALDYLPSPGWAVIYGETPSATRWSELGDNDDSLATGAGIDDLAILNRHIAAAALYANKFTNPYKFGVYRVASTSTSTGLQRANFDTKRHDTSSNYSTSTYRFTAPVAGFYQFNMAISIAVVTPTRMFPIFYKNGVEIARGTDIAAACQGVSLSAHLQLAAADYIEAWFYINIAGGNYHGSVSFFDGYLISVA